MTEIKYEIISGSLPVNVTLNEDTGEIIGDIDFANVGLGPEWVSPPAGKLGDFLEGDSVNITFDARYGSNDELALMGVVNNGTFLPRGLVFDPDTGVLSGICADLLAEEAIGNVDPPIWQTRFGTLAMYDEGVNANVSVTATAQAGKSLARYAIVSGGLPWGLTLDFQTGAITGLTADLKSPGVTIEVPKLPAPVFVHPAGNIATYNEGETFSGLFVNATPAVDRQMVKYVITRGFLPRGVILNTVSGEISGTAVEMLGIEEPPFFFTELYPTFSSEVLVDSVSQTSSNLGSYARGTAVSAQFAATPTGSRTIMTYSLESGGLPYGLTLSSTGLISGTISNQATNSAPSGTYNFTVRVTDNQYGFATRSFNITVL
jgi:hypothetical protein